MCPQNDSPDILARDPAIEAATPQPTEPKLDAGNRHHDHYARRLPPWRNALRKRLIPIVRWETPYLALMQDKLRTPALDSYFAYTANLGTHTFFMVMLPILFWCGFTFVGRAMVHMLAAGVYWSGFIKDMLCLPRPLSPPLSRISMSGSAALEYGFPSSHSTNAVSVAVYAIWMLQNSADEHRSSLFLALQGLSYFYALSIIFGRLYCGMHGFLDVVVGSLLGAAIAVVQLLYGDWFDIWIADGPFVNTMIAVLVILVLVRIHPEPADDCPCFDDSVSFAGVVIGIQQNPISVFSPNPTLNGVFDADNSQTLYFFIDLKTSGEETWSAVLAAIAPLQRAGYLSSYDGTKFTSRPVTVIGTGNTPLVQVQKAIPRYAFYDAPLPLLSSTFSNITAFDSPIASTDFAASFGSVRNQQLNDTQQATLKAQVGAAHAKGIKTRYWNQPGWPIGTRNAVWRALWDGGVDLINVDDLEGAAQFWETRG